LYSALAVHAGVHRDIVVDDPRVAADLLVRADGAQFAWLVSHASEPATLKSQLATPLRLQPICGGAATAADDGSVTIAPYGVCVVRLEE
jgi:hypothetical protein